MLVLFLSRLTISEQPTNKGKSRLRGGERVGVKQRRRWRKIPEIPLQELKKNPGDGAPEYLPRKSQSMFVFLFVCCEAEAPLSEIDYQGLKNASGKVGKGKRDRAPAAKSQPLSYTPSGLVMIVQIV